MVEININSIGSCTKILYSLSPLQLKPKGLGKNIFLKHIQKAANGNRNINLNY